MTTTDTRDCGPTDAMCRGTCNISERVREMARRHPAKRAVVVASGGDAAGRPRFRHLTFEQLDQEIDRYARGLEAAGLKRSMRCIVMVPAGLEFFALTFALFRMGAVAVLIDPGMGRRNLIECLAEVEAEAFVGVPAAQAARTIYARRFRSVQLAVTAGRRWFWGGLRLADVRSDPWRPYETVPCRSDDLAAILFTSGSTCPANGVCYEHGMFDAQVRYLNAQYGYAPDDVDVATFPLFALFDAALGLTAVIPEMDASRPARADPRKIIAAIEANRATHMFASPALLDRLSRYATNQGTALASLRRVMTAGAPVPHSLLEGMGSVLAPDAEIHTPYGATEALPVTSIESREILGETRYGTMRGEGICVGRPMPGLRVSVIEIRGEPIADWSQVSGLPTGRIGEICVKGPVVTRAYFRNAAATAQAKIADGGECWHRMGDVGYLDGRGRLWYCGRKAHRVQTERGTLFTICCEAMFNQHPRVRRTALVGIGGSAGRQRPVLCVELEDGRSGGRSRVRQELLEIARSNEKTSEIETILFHPSFPVDVRHNAKIFREKLAEWAAERTA